MNYVLDTNIIFLYLRDQKAKKEYLDDVFLDLLLVNKQKLDEQIN